MEEEILNKLMEKFEIKGEIKRKRRIWINIDKDKLIDICKFIKEIGFEHLSAISVTDWIEHGKYEITYHLWSYKYKLLITLKTKIDRENPVIKSVSQIWDRNAQIHERELHELFGVKFEGNDDLTPLFLEDWEGPPPFKKDFDWREYVRKEFYNKENERERAYYD